MEIKYKVLKLKDDTSQEVKDSVSIEEPLEMKLKFKSKDNWKSENLSITMRTPGNDEDYPGAETYEKQLSVMINVNSYSFRRS